MLFGMARQPYESDTLFVPADADRSDVPPEVGLSAARFFPPPTATTPEGLLCIGGRLTPDWLLDAYGHGIFPWPMWDDEPIAWWSPNPRAIIELDGLQVPRRLARTLRSGCFLATCDRDFEGVIRGCASAGDRVNNTWLTAAMIEAYRRMHALGYAHSVEVWLPSPIGRGAGGEGASPLGKVPHPNPLPKGEGMHLAGGTYGIAIGGLFAAESMFYRERDASKIALAHLVNHLRACGYRLFDIQQWTPHTGRLGAVEIPRLEYLRRLAQAIELPVTFGSELVQESL